MNSECERQRQREGNRQAEERAECQREVQVEHRTEPTFPRNDNRQTRKNEETTRSQPAGMRDRNIIILSTRLSESIWTPTRWPEYTKAATKI